jgi:hypothetical protein
MPTGPARLLQSAMLMSAIPPPPIAGVVDEAYEVRRESGQALESLRKGHLAEGEHGQHRTWLRSFVRLALLGAVVAVVAWRSARAIASR